MLQWTLRCMDLFELQFSLDICPGLELWNHMETLFFSFLKNILTVLHSGCTNLHSHKGYRRLLFPPPSLQIFFLSIRSKSFKFVSSCISSIVSISLIIASLLSLVHLESQFHVRPFPYMPYAAHAYFRILIFFFPLSPHQSGCFLFS